MSLHAVPVTLVGGPTVVLRYAGLTIVTDPTFSPAGTYGNLIKTDGPAVPLDRIGPVDVVLLSHDQHEDNLDPAGRELLASVPYVFTTPSGGERIPGATGIDRWRTAIIPVDGTQVTVTAVRGRHGPKSVVPLTGEVTGFVVEAPGWPTVYFSGDNSSVRIAGKVAARFPQVDVVIVCAGAARSPRIGDAKLTLNATRAVQVAGLWPDAAVIPVHIDDWAHFSERREDFLASWSAQADLERLTMLERGETVSVPRPPRAE